MVIKNAIKELKLYGSDKPYGAGSKSEKMIIGANLRRVFDTFIEISFEYQTL